jgi:hypothetical protein
MLLTFFRRVLWMGLVLLFYACSSTDTETPIQSPDSVLSDQSISSDSTLILSGMDRIAAIQDRLQALSDTIQDTNPEQRYRILLERYTPLHGDDGYLNLMDRSMVDIDTYLGVAPIVIKQSVAGAPVRLEIRVYLPYREDSTGLYLFFQNERIVAFKLDEFNGIQNSDLLDFFNSH